jgi:hypothetical protein
MDPNPAIRHLMDMATDRVVIGMGLGLVVGILVQLVRQVQLVLVPQVQPAPMA